MSEAENDRTGEDIAEDNARFREEQYRKEAEERYPKDGDYINRDGLIVGYISGRLKSSQELEAKDREIEDLVSVMVAAAEEIQEHWQAHCDEDGCGPANLMHRLEKGIAANYPGYKFGEFTKMQAEVERLTKENEWVSVEDRNRNPEFDQVVEVWDDEAKEPTSKFYTGGWHSRYTHWRPIVPPKQTQP